jgi:hypothetical protein
LHEPFLFRKELGEIDSACCIEGFQLFGGEFQIQTGEIVLELRYLPRSNDRDYWHRLMPQPGECDLRQAATGPLILSLDEFQRRFQLHLLPMRRSFATTHENQRWERKG